MFTDDIHLMIDMYGDEGKSEGDTINIKVPNGDIILDMNVTLNQQDYRYRDFGTFDQCIEKLGARC